LNIGDHHMTRHRWIAASLVLGLAATARAEGSEEAPAVEGARSLDGAEAARDGFFLPSTLSARVGETPAYASAFGGYDTAHQGPVAATTAEVRLWGPVALRAGAQYSSARGGARPSVGGRAQLLRQERHGIDGAVSVFYQPEGFTEPEGEIETFLSVGRRMGRLSVLGNLVYGQDPEGNERDGEIRCAAQAAAGRFTVGVDSRVRFAIGAQPSASAAAEPKLDLLAGPFASAMVGPVVLFAEAGPSLLRAAGGTTAGVAGVAGVGAVY
jgi:hypothetical protein